MEEKKPPRRPSRGKKAKPQSTPDKDAQSARPDKSAGKKPAVTNGRRQGDQAKGQNQPKQNNQSKAKAQTQPKQNNQPKAKAQAQPKQNNQPAPKPQTQPKPTKAKARSGPFGRDFDVPDGQPGNTIVTRRAVYLNFGKDAEEAAKMERRARERASAKADKPAKQSPKQNGGGKETNAPAKRDNASPRDNAKAAGKAAKQNDSAKAANASAKLESTPKRDNGGSAENTAKQNNSSPKRDNAKAAGKPAKQNVSTKAENIPAKRENESENTKGDGDVKQKKKGALPKAKQKRLLHDHAGHSRRTDEKRAKNDRGERFGHRASPVGESFTGIFRASGKGYGFVSPEAGGDDIFVPPPYVGDAMSGDTVEAQRISESGGRGRGSEAAVLSVVKRARESVIGTLRMAGANMWVEPDDPSLKTFGAVTDAVVDAAPGDKVELRILRYPGDFEPKRLTVREEISADVRNNTDRKKNDRRGRTKNYLTREIELTFSGEITDDLGSAESRGANYEAILREQGIRQVFPDFVVAEAERVSGESITPDGRLDLRESVIFTIDGAGAKDLDDAISLEKTDSGYRLGVHIADVSHYVTENSATDVEALARGTSVYFIDKVVPMLPVALSNGSCSLNGGEDKYALSAFIDLDENGEMTGYDFKKTIIRSKVRGVYDEVNDLFEHGEKSEFYEKYREVYPSLTLMHGLYLILAENAKKRGALELDSPEAEIVLGGDGLPESVRPRVRGDGEKLIEQFMLAANVAAANFMTKNSIPGVYRIHEAPDGDKLRTFIVFAHNAGLDVSKLGKVTAEGAQVSASCGVRELSAVLAEAEEKGIGEVVSSVLLRSMMKARYESAPAPHFGLSAPLYCHFTSPIRRYPDLFVHRSISAYLEGKRSPSGGTAAEAARSSSDREIAAQTAERRIEALYLCLWMREHLGEVFEAQISGVSSFGIFARTDMLCEGMIPVESLGDVLDFDENAFTMRVQGNGGAKTYRLGDRIRVVACAADPVTQKITFLPA